MEFRILGSLEAIGDDGIVSLGGMKPRALLAILLLNANQPVSGERLAIALWGDDAAGRTVVKTVQVHISRLRKALGEPGIVATTRAGYSLRVGPDELDATRFSRLVEAGRTALAGDDPRLAGSVLREALALWRGPALADLAFEPFAQIDIARLNEERLAALETRIEADLASGHDGELIGELYQLVSANPTRERLSSHLMLALYRCGRHAEALDAYTRLRTSAAHEFGLEPSATIKALQARILEQSPTLDRAEAPPAVAPAIQTRAAAPRRTPAARGPMIGRAAELGELRHALDDASEARGSVFVLLGDAGIGKTRLAEALADEAAQRGHDVLWGSAWEAGGASAFWPWTQLIRQLLDARTPEEAIADLGEGAPYVAQIAPEVGPRLGTYRDRLPTLESEAARFSAFDAIVSFLRASSARRPIVVVLDDLHAADAPSVRLVEFLARGLHGAHLLVIATCRTDGVRRDTEITRALTDLARPAQQIALTGLTREDVLALAATRSPLPMPAELVDRLHALTGGNPLFVDEVLRLLDAQGALASPEALAAARLSVPDAVRETVARRLDALAPGAARALTVAAVIGSEFGLDTLAPVLGEKRAAVLALLDAAAGAGLVQALAGTLGRYRFTHGLVRETLYDSLGAGVRASTHERVGETILELHGDGPDAPLSVLAHHFLGAAPAGDADRAVSYAARAGERALELMAYEQAIEHFEDALRALELAPRQPARRGPILLGLGKAEMRAGRLDVSRANLRRAAGDARIAGDAELLARAALASSPWGLATALADEENLIPLIEDALERMPPDDCALRAQLLARLAAATYWSSSAAQRDALVGEAIAMARRVGDPETLALVLSDAHRATWDPDSPDRSLPWASEIYAVAERYGNTELAMIAHSWRISLLLELGELAIVDREIATFKRAASRLHQQRGQAQALLHSCARAIMDGRFTEAEGHLGEVSVYATLLQQDPFLSMRMGALAFVMREAQGRLVELEAGVRHFADTQPAMPVWRCGLLCVYLQGGRETELRREYGRLVGALDALPRDNLWLPALALLSEACAHLGDRAGAPVLRSLLEPYAGRNAVTPDVAFLGPVDRYLALLAATEGDEVQAAVWFASARELAERMGAQPTLARLAFDEAAWLPLHGDGRGADLVAEAIARADALGLEWLAARARELGAARARARASDVLLDRADRP